MRRRRSPARGRAWPVERKPSERSRPNNTVMDTPAAVTDVQRPARCQSSRRVRAADVIRPARKRRRNRESRGGRGPSSEHEVSLASSERCAPGAEGEHEPVISYRPRGDGPLDGEEVRPPSGVLLAADAVFPCCTVPSARRTVQYLELPTCPMLGAGVARLVGSMDKGLWKDLMAAHAIPQVDTRCRDGERRALTPAARLRQARRLGSSSDLPKRRGRRSGRWARVSFRHYPMGVGAHGAGPRVECSVLPSGPDPRPPAKSWSHGGLYDYEATSPRRHGARVQARTPHLEGPPSRSRCFASWSAPNGPGGLLLTDDGVL